MMTTHTNKEYEQELRGLRDRLCAMGGRCEQQIMRAMHALDDRDVVEAKKVIETDLERIGDLAAGIAKRAIELNPLPQLQPTVELGSLAALVQKNLRAALDSF